MFSLGVENGTAEVLDMRVCPFATHEADYERVSVLVCQADGAIKQVRWCGEKTFETALSARWVG